MDSLASEALSNTFNYIACKTQCLAGRIMDSLASEALSNTLHSLVVKSILIINKQVHTMCTPTHHT